MQILCRLTATTGEHNWLNRSHTLGLVIKNLLDAQVLNNRLYLQLHSRVPPLYRSGVRYENEPLWTFQDHPVEEFALIPVVLGRGWGDCLVPGTLVNTPDALVPIEKLKVGDLVVTRDGNRRISRHELTTIHSPVMEVLTSDGRTLTGTRRHPVYTGERGFVFLSELCPGDTLYSLEGKHPQVESIRKVPELSPTYNLTVEDQHQFFANGLLTHNCDDLAPWRVSELQAHGEKAKIRIQWKRPTLANGTKGKKYFHIVVRRQSGAIEDPSAKLGMYERMGAAP